MLPRVNLNLSPADLIDMANYIYDRQQSTPLEERHVNNIAQWIGDWHAESMHQRITRHTRYVKNPETRTPEYHRQLVKLARRAGMVKET